MATRSVAELDHLSKSAVELYADCGRAWKDKYLDGRKSPTTPALLIGSAFDRALESFLRSRLELGTAPALPPLWLSAWQEQVGRDDIDWQGDLPEQVENVGARLIHHPGTLALLNKLRLLVDEQGPWLQRRVELRVPGVDVPVIGFIDLVEADGVPGDFKTAGRAWYAEQPLKELQPRIYLAALLQQGYPAPRGPNGGYLFRHYVWLKTKETRLQTFETEYSAASIMAGVVAVRAAWRGIQSGVFLRNSESWRCGPRFCPAWHECFGVK